MAIPALAKTSLLYKLTDNNFTNDTTSTIGVDFRTKVMNIDNQKIKLSIWDTAGQERFRAITAPYYRNVHGTILVYDITNRESFNHLNKWITDIDKYSRENVSKILIGNKTDLQAERKVSYDEGQQLAKDQGFHFIEISAKTTDNIEDVFVVMINEICKDAINMNIYQPTKINKPREHYYAQHYNNNDEVKIDNCEC